MNHSNIIIATGSGNIDNVSSSSCVAFESENTNSHRGNRKAAGVREHVARRLETVVMNNSLMETIRGCWMQDVCTCLIDLQPCRTAGTNMPRCQRFSNGSWSTTPHAVEIASRVGICSKHHAHMAHSVQDCLTGDRKTKTTHVSNQEILWKRACRSPVEHLRAYDNESLAVHSARLISWL
jgi:hypothetical protein